MSEKYYGAEDEVEAPDTQLANLRAHESAIGAVDIWAEETLVGIGNAANAIWDAAAQRGDVQGQTLANELYQGAKHLKDTLLYNNTAMKSVLETAKALDAQKQKAEGDLSTLLTAIENVDYKDDRISNLIEVLESDIYEMVAEQAQYDDGGWDDSSDYDNIVSEVYGTIRTLSPSTSYFTAERFFATLKGDFEMNDIQRGLLLSLLNTFVDEAKPK